MAAYFNKNTLNVLGNGRQYVWTYLTECFVIRPCQSLFCLEIDQCPTVILWSVTEAIPNEIQ